MPTNPTGVLIKHFLQADDEQESKGSRLETLSQIEAFNRDALKLGERGWEAISKERDRAAKLWGIEGPAFLRILSRHALAGEISTLFQKKRHRILLSTFLLGLAAFASLEFYEYFYASLFHHDPRSVLLLVGYIVILVLAYGAFALAAWRKYQNKHLDYRALAEGLRVQAAWTAAGLPDDVSDHYLTKHSGELGWIRQAIRMGNIAHHGTTSGNEVNRIKNALELWVRDQRDYYQRAWHRNERKVRRQEIITNGLFGAAVLIALGMIFGHHALEEATVFHSALGYSISLFFAMAAAASGYAEKMVFGEQAKQYHRMGRQFDEAYADIKEAMGQGDLEGAQALLREIGKEALSENSDWVLLHRARPLEGPRGG